MKTSLAVTLLAAALSANALPRQPTLQSRQAPPPRRSDVIYSCTAPNTIALTYDDGAYIFTEQLLDRLDAAGFKATFFVNGDNWSNIQDYRSTIQRIVNSGHQVGSHTYSHPDLATISSADVESEMTRLETEFFDILGKTPTYMRAPFLSVNDNVMAVMKKLQYKVIDIDVDTLDWQNNTPETVGQAYANFEEGFNNGATIALMHETHNTTVNVLTPDVIDLVKQSGRRAVTVGECLGDATANWYRANGAYASR